jgi:hypothetical protein
MRNVFYYGLSKYAHKVHSEFYLTLLKQCGQPTENFLTQSLWCFDEQSRLLVLPIINVLSFLHIASPCTTAKRLKYELNTNFLYK